MAKKETHNDDVLTLSIQPFLMPLALVLSSAIIATSIFLGFDKLADNGVTTNTNTTAGDTTTETTTTDAGTVTADMETIKSLFSDDNITFGNADSKLLFVEVSDPSCPFCHIAGGENPELSSEVGERFQYDTDGGSYVPPVREMKKLVDEGKAAFVWIYSNGHGNGELATQSLYCAKEKGKFWEAHDILMSNAGYDKINNEIKNDKANSKKLAEFLKDAVDSKFMEECLSSGKYESKIDENQSLASSIGVSGTPGFFVNTTNFAGAYSFTDMQSAVDEALN
jgi:protein-disulfide isomerase